MTWTVSDAINLPIPIIESKKIYKSQSKAYVATGNVATQFEVKCKEVHSGTLKGPEA